MKFITVEIMLDDTDVERLKALLPYYQQYKSETDGTFPFKDWTVEKLAQGLMEVGSGRILREKIALEEWRQGLITHDEWKQATTKE